jgi:hypothetical protein
MLIAVASDLDQEIGHLTNHFDSEGPPESAQRLRTASSLGLGSLLNFCRPWMICRLWVRISSVSRRGSCPHPSDIRSDQIDLSPEAQDPVYVPTQWLMAHPSSSNSREERSSAFV